MKDLTSDSDHAAKMADPATKSNCKRTLADMYGALSDDEDDDQDALCIDADLPEMQPKAKRSRVQDSKQKAVDANELFMDDDDFEITPPPSPEKTAAAPAKPPSLQQRLRTAATRMNIDEQYEEELLRNYDFERRRVHKRIPGGAFMYATAEDGSRGYMQLKSREVLESEVRECSSKRSLDLLGTPLAVLKAQLEEQRRRRVLDEAERLSQAVVETTAEGDGEEDVDSTKGNLWVERYSPRAYTELLSDESTNRTMLKWLRLWDHVVFGKELKDDKNKNKTDQKKQDQQKKFFNRNLPEISDELDQHKRPLHRIALLCGPPGLGKTTLAHVIAQHAGYNVVEMNASDDRSPDIFKKKIEAATQMKSVLGADPRPNCLIIDEIDGAPQPAINMLLTLSKHGDKDAATTKKKKREGGLLMRPIICICNDLYVPSLRQLRQSALVITFPPTVAVKLAGRLMDISRHEKIKVDLTTMLALCEKADNDIRSCLNTLQFVKSKSAQLSLQNVTSLSLGQKDAHKSLFTVWQHIFTMPRQKRKRYVNPYDRAAMTQDAAEELALANNNTSSSARFHNTLQLAIAAGETQKVMQGLYENYLESKAKDPRMEKLNCGIEWLQFVDCLEEKVIHHQNYSLMRYYPYMSVAFHLCFAANNPNKIVYPHAQFEFRTKLQRSENLVTTMMGDVTPSVRRNLDVTTVVTEVLPPLLNIIQPTLRPVNTQLYSSREKDDLAQLVRVMIAYNMTYRQERSADGQYAYSLDPNMEEVTRFTGQKPGRVLTYAAKQLISREIDMEKMRRSESGRSSAPVVERKPEKEATNPATAVPNHLRQKLQPKALAPQEVESHAVDFFGRKIVRTPVDQSGSADGTAPRPKSKPKQEVIGGDIWFRFKEGYTNAVRRTVKVQDLL